MSMIESATYIPNAAGLKEFETIDLARHLQKVGQEIQRGARRQVGVDSGRLRASIHIRQGADSRGQFVVIGSQLDHALPHHEGQRPHVIEPASGRYLRFASRGKVVYARRVVHPGTQPNHYLTDPMRRVVLTS